MRFNSLRATAAAALIVVTAIPTTAFAQATTPQPAPVRPQTPIKPYPYGEVEASYDNPARPGVRLAGTLTVPKGKGPFPAVLLITGSGQQDRDETGAGHKPFLVLADYLTRRGIAVLRVDDRGVGGSTGAGSEDTHYDYATDVSAGVEWLKTRPEIDGKRIGLIGHSEGAVAAPLVARSNRSVAFAILWAGAAVKMRDVVLEQSRAIWAASGETPEKIEFYDKLNREFVDMLIAAPDQASAYAAGMKMIAAAGLEAQLGPRMNMMSSAWYRAILGYDPEPDLRALKIPVLVLMGGKDLQAIASQNIPSFEAALAGNPQAKAMVLPGLNHLLQRAETGAPSEYATITQTMAPEALKVMGDWLVEVTR